MNSFRFLLTGAPTRGNNQTSSSGESHESRGEAIVMSRRFTIARLVLGGLLLAAASLKLYGLSVSAVPRVGWFAQPWVQLAAVEWELVLGLWLLSGAYPIGSWLAAVATFLAFAGVSGYLGWVGVASCGCFGTIHASPWHAFAVDLVALFVLLGTRPVLAIHSRLGMQGRSKPAIQVACVASGVCAAIAGFAVLAPHKATRILAELRDERFVVLPADVDIGDCDLGQAVDAELRVHNLSGRPARLVGGTVDCSCDLSRSLPATIPPGESHEVTIRLRIKEARAGAFARTVRLLTDDPDQPTIVVLIHGRVRG